MYTLLGIDLVAKSQLSSLIFLISSFYCTHQELEYGCNIFPPLSKYIDFMLTVQWMYFPNSMYPCSAEVSFRMAGGEEEPQGLTYFSLFSCNQINTEPTAVSGFSHLSDFNNINIKHIDVV